MIFRAFLYSCKEGILGVIRHPLVTIASVTTILLMLLIMSTFMLFSSNARHIMQKIGQQPPLEVYMRLDATEDQRAGVRAYLDQAVTEVLYYEESSPQQNYERFRENLGDSASILDDFDYATYLPYTFAIQLTDPEYADEVVMRAQGLPGVNKVLQERQVMVFLSQAMRVVNIGTVVAFVVLFIIALFIISNMVRISVYSRSDEINIMKYVGATNGYIRMPFIVEGAFVGALSAILAWLLSYYGYATIYARAMRNIDAQSFYALLPIGDLSTWILLVCLSCGIFIGAVGSGVSVRKYIRV